MGISIIILCLVLQRFASIEYGVYRLPPYFGRYYHTLIILPVVVIISLFFVSIYHFTGDIGYYLMSAILFWVAVDCRNKNLLNESTATVDELFIAVYNRFFAPAFWYVILGPAGLILYTAVVPIVKLKRLLDWIPLRLVG